MLTSHRHLQVHMFGHCSMFMNGSRLKYTLILCQIRLSCWKVLTIKPWIPYYMPQMVLTLHVVSINIISPLYMRKQWSREVKQTAQCHTASEWQGWCLNPSSPILCFKNSEIWLSAYYVPGALTTLCHGYSQVCELILVSILENSFFNSM